MHSFHGLSLNQSCPRVCKIPALLCGVQDVEAELEEATRMRSEAQELGEVDIIPELAAVEERLQVGSCISHQELVRHDAWCSGSV